MEAAQQRRDTRNISYCNGQIIASVNKEKKVLNKLRQHAGSK